MSYCTLSDIQTRTGSDQLLALADHDGDGSPDQAVVDRAIDDAESLINSYLGARYSVPLDDTPDSIRACAVSLAVYFLQLGRDSVTPDVRADYESQLGWLEEVARGQVSLGTAAEPDRDPEAPGVRYDGATRLFGRERPL